MRKIVSKIFSSCGDTPISGLFMSVVDIISTCVKSPLDLSRPHKGKQDTAKIRLPPKVPLLNYALARTIFTAWGVDGHLKHQLAQHRVISDI
jgi:hypothetical protein